MKFSVNWLREFVDLPNNPEEIAELLTRAGIEIKKIEPRGAITLTIPKNGAATLSGSAWIGWR